MSKQTLQTATGLTLAHRDGWMTETEVARSIGVAMPKYVRELPIARTSIRRPNAKYERNRYRAEDVKAYLEANTNTPEPANPVFTG